MNDDYYEELLDCRQAAKDGLIELWEYVDVYILKKDYDKYQPKSPYVTKEELLLLMIKDYETTLKRIAKIR